MKLTSGILEMYSLNPKTHNNIKWEFMPNKLTKVVKYKKNLKTTWMISKKVDKEEKWNKKKGINIEQIKWQF